MLLRFFFLYIVYARALSNGRALFFCLKSIKPEFFVSFMFLCAIIMCGGDIMDIENIKSRNLNINEIYVKMINEGIFSFVIDLGKSYYLVEDNRLLDKDDSFIPLIDCLKCYRFNNLIREVYGNYEEVYNVISSLNNYLFYCTINKDYALDVARKFFFGISEGDVDEDKCTIFSDIIAEEILYQLYNNNCALIHNEYPDSNVLDEAISEADLTPILGAVALSVTPNAINIDRGYSALKVIYNLEEPKKRVLK